MIVRIARNRSQSLGFWEEPQQCSSRWSGWSKTFWPAFHCIGHGFLFGPIPKDWQSGMVCSVKPNNFWLPLDPPTQIHPGGPIDFVKGFRLSVQKFGFFRTTDTSKTVFLICRQILGDLNYFCVTALSKHISRTGLSGVTYENLDPM